MSRIGQVIFNGETVELVLHGLVTYYVAREGAITKSGEPYSRNANTCAVDISEWKRLGGHRLFIIGDIGWGTVKVNDTGYLYRAGKFEQKTLFGIRRWWRSNQGLRIVLDLPVETFGRLLKGYGTQEIWVYDLGKEERKWA